MEDPKNLNGAAFDSIGHDVRWNDQFPGIRNPARTPHRRVGLKPANFPDDTLNLLFRQSRTFPGDEGEQVIEVLFRQVKPPDDHRCFPFRAVLIFFFILATTSAWS